MPRFRPEDGVSNSNEKPEPGTYAMELGTSADFNDEAGNWEATLINFRCADGKAIADRVTPNTVWKFRRLADALGDDAKARYADKDAAGFSKFTPDEFEGRHVKITIKTYEWNGKSGVRVEDVEQCENPDADPVDKTTETSSAHAVPNDDIPF